VQAVSYKTALISSIIDRRLLALDKAFLGTIQFSMIRFAPKGGNRRYYHVCFSLSIESQNFRDLFSRPSHLYDFQGTTASQAGMGIYHVLTRVSSDKWNFWGIFWVCSLRPAWLLHRHTPDNPFACDKKQPRWVNQEMAEFGIRSHRFSVNFTLYRQAGKPAPQMISNISPKYAI
jgi:hypothetical protein